MSTRRGVSQSLGAPWLGPQRERVVLGSMWVDRCPCPHTLRMSVCGSCYQVHPWQSTAQQTIFQRTCTIHTHPGQGLRVSPHHEQSSSLCFTVTAALRGGRGGVAMPGAWCPLGTCLSANGPSVCGLSADSRYEASSNTQSADTSAPCGFSPLCLRDINVKHKQF